MFPVQMKTRFLNWLCFRWPFYWIPALRTRREAILRFVREQFVKTVYGVASSPLYDIIEYPTGRPRGGKSPFLEQ